MMPILVIGSMAQGNLLALMYQNTVVSPHDRGDGKVVKTKLGLRG